MNVLVSGASGFVGSALLPRLIGSGENRVTVAVRRKLPDLPRSVRQVCAEDLGPRTGWRAALQGIDTVAHLAARVHVMRDAAADPLMAFRCANVEGSVRFARQAADAGVRRFVFLSSVKVNGEGADRPYRESDVPDPQGAYAVSKHEAELGLQAVAAETGMEVTVIRPPLAYGPGVQANFRTLMNAVASGVPLPVGAIENRRSLVAVYNLADFVATCLAHRNAGNQTFLVSDGEDLSTPELIRRLARAMNRPARLLPVPPALLKGAATLLGQRAAAHRLCGSLQVDIRKARELLEWKPPLSVNEALDLLAERVC